MEDVSKRCAKCGETKALDGFSFRNKAAGELQSRCKACMTELWKRWYAKPENRARHIRHNGGTSRIIVERNQLFMTEYLSTQSCVECGIDDIRVLEFDHVRDTKLADVSSTISAGWSIAKIEAEIAKCEVVCANCHRIRTCARTGSYKHAWVMGDEELESPAASM